MTDLQVTGIIEFHDAVTPENTASQTRDEAFRGGVPLEATTGDLHSMRSSDTTRNSVLMSRPLC